MQESKGKSNCISPSCKISAIGEKVLLMNSFINSQFGYCPLIWSFCTRELNDKINRIHERGLRLVYLDYTSSFKDLLEKDKSVTIHQRNIRLLAIEMFKVLNGFG